MAGIIEIVFIDAITCTIITMHICECAYVSSQIFFKNLPPPNIIFMETYKFLKLYSVSPRETTLSCSVPT